MAKLEIIAIMQANVGAAHSICNVRFNFPNEIHVVFHSGFNYDYHYIIKVLAENFEEQFEYLG